jgi:tRNA threonylcarbamoyladenosine biosynthesis protein TsaB
MVSREPILAIDTAGPYLSLALRSAQQIYRWQGTGEIKQQEYLTQSLQLLLGQAGIGLADVGMITCMRGPGTFTGLRVGMAAAKAIAYAIKAPLVSLPTLAVYAQSLRRVAYSAIVLDARKDRYYVQLFHEGVALSPVQDISAKAIETLMLAQATVDWHLSGYGVSSFIEKLGSTQLHLQDVSPTYYDAAMMMELAEVRYKEYGCDAYEQGPEYLRLSEAQLSLQERGESLC